MPVPPEAVPDDPWQHPGPEFVFTLDSSTSAGDTTLQPATLQSHRHRDANAPQPTPERSGANAASIAWEQPEPLASIIASGREAGG